MTARRVEPGQTNPVAFLDDLDARSDGDHRPDALVSGNERERGLQRPIAVRGVQIGVADAAGLGLDDDLTGARSRNFPLPDDQRLSELLDDRRSHLVCHESLLLLLDVVDAYAGASIEVTRTSFLFTNSWMPRLESSRP